MPYNKFHYVLWSCLHYFSVWRYLLVTVVIIPLPHRQLPVNISIWFPCQINLAQSPEPFSIHPSISNLLLSLCSWLRYNDYCLLGQPSKNSKPPVIPQSLLLLNTHIFMKYCYPVAAIALNSTSSLSSKTASLSLEYWNNLSSQPVVFPHLQQCLYRVTI